MCDEIGLTKQSPADVAICTSIDKFQRAENIRALFEVKMSIVWNWELIPKQIHVLTEMPMTAAGKILKRELKQKLEVMQAHAECQDY